MLEFWRKVEIESALLEIMCVIGKLGESFLYIYLKGVLMFWINFKKD